MSALSDADAAGLAAELEQITGLKLSDLVDLEKLPDGQRAPIVDGWRELGKLSWTVQPSAMSRVLTILNVLASVANPVTAITGGVTSFAGAIAAIKGA